MSTVTSNNNNNHQDDEINAGRFWKYSSHVPGLLRIALDQIRLLDIEHRQSTEALIDLSTRTLPLDPRMLSGAAGSSSSSSSSGSKKLSIYEDQTFSEMMSLSSSANTGENQSNSSNENGPTVPGNSASTASGQGSSSSSSSINLPNQVIFSLQKQQQDELRTIARLEDAVVKTAERKVEVAKNCVQELQLLIEKFRDDEEGEDVESGSDDDDEYSSSDDEEDDDQ